MFHIHNFDGINYNVPLERLKDREIERIRHVKKNYANRRIIERDRNKADIKKHGKGFSPAEKAYREMIQMKNENDPLLHAYDIMSSPVKTIGPDINVRDAWKSFTSEGVAHMPVVTPEKRGGNPLPPKHHYRYCVPLPYKCFGTSSGSIL